MKIYYSYAAVAAIIMAGASTMSMALPYAYAAPSTESCDNFEKSPNAQANYNPHCLGDEGTPPVPSCQSPQELFVCRNQPTTPNEE